MKPKLSIPLSLLARFAFGSKARASTLQPASVIDLPGISGDVDHLAIDTAGQRLFLAVEDNGTLRLINLKTGKLEETVNGFNTPHSILFAASSKRVICHGWFQSRPGA